MSDYWRDQLASLNPQRLQALAAAGLLRDLITGDRLDIHVRAALGLRPETDQRQLPSLALSLEKPTNELQTHPE
jgi:hypothetical protein